MNTNSFFKFRIKPELLMDLGFNAFPSRLYGWDNVVKLRTKTSTYFGFIYEGKAKIHSKFGDFELRKGMYFSIPGSFSILGGKGVIIECLNYKSMFMVGGAIEKTGRLNYIDGCTDSLLISPVKFGDPCLNVLYFPSKIYQTQHTHPSFRIGVVVQGKGLCKTPNKKYMLNSGDVFVIPEGGIHSFETPYNTTMTVIAYHPDSDFGPQDEDHPMINRTIVNGKSAKEISSILTK